MICGTYDTYIITDMKVATQPLVAAVNCSLWVYYGLFKKERDLPLAAANAPGIIFGLITALTALF